MRARYQGRIAVALLFVVPLLAPSAATAAAQKSGPLASVPLELDGRLPVVSLQVGGEGPLRFLVASGTAETAVDGRLVERLGLTPDGRAWVGPPGEAGSLQGDRVRLPSVRLGELELRDVEAVALDLAGFLGGEDAPDGTLGYGLFQGRAWTLDYAGERLIVERQPLPAPDGETVLAMVPDELGRPTISLEIAGREMRSHLESARFGGITLHGRHMEELPLASEPGMIGRARTAGATFDLYGARLDGEARIGAHVLARPRLLFSDMEETANLGAAALEEFAVTFDHANRRIRFIRRESRRVRLLHERGARVPSLDGGDELRAAFNRDAGKVRLLLILSPT